MHQEINQSIIIDFNIMFPVTLTVLFKRAGGRVPVELSSSRSQSAVLDM